MPGISHLNHLTHQASLREYLSTIANAKSLAVNTQGQIVPVDFFSTKFSNLSTNRCLLELKILEILTHGKKWLGAGDIELIKSIAQKVGLVLENKESFKNHRELRFLIGQIANQLVSNEKTSLKDDALLCEAFRFRYQKELAPEYKQCEQITRTFAEIIEEEEETASDDLTEGFTSGSQDPEHHDQEVVIPALIEETSEVLEPSSEQIVEKAPEVSAAALLVIPDSPETTTDSSSSPVLTSSIDFIPTEEARPEPVKTKIAISKIRNPLIKDSSSLSGLSLTTKVALGAIGALTAGAAAYYSLNSFNFSLPLTPEATNNETSATDNVVSPQGNLGSPLNNLTLPQDNLGSPKEDQCFSNEMPVKSNASTNYTHGPLFKEIDSQNVVDQGNVDPANEPENASGIALGTVATGVGLVMLAVGAAVYKFFKPFNGGGLIPLDESKNLENPPTFKEPEDALGSNPPLADAKPQTKLEQTPESLNDEHPWDSFGFINPPEMYTSSEVSQEPSINADVTEKVLVLLNSSDGKSSSKSTNSDLSESTSEEEAKSASPEPKKKKSPLPPIDIPPRTTKKADTPISTPSPTPSPRADESVIDKIVEIDLSQLSARLKDVKHTFKKNNLDGEISDPEKLGQALKNVKSTIDVVAETLNSPQAESIEKIIELLEDAMSSITPRTEGKITKFQERAQSYPLLFLRDQSTENILRTKRLAIQADEYKLALESRGIGEKEAGLSEKIIHMKNELAKLDRDTRKPVNVDKAISTITQFNKTEKIILSSIIDSVMRSKPVKKPEELSAEEELIWSMYTPELIIEWQFVFTLNLDSWAMELDLKKDSVPFAYKLFSLEASKSPTKQEKIASTKAVSEKSKSRTPKKTFLTKNEVAVTYFSPKKPGQLLDLKAEVKKLKEKTADLVSDNPKITKKVFFEEVNDIVDGALSAEGFETHEGEVKESPVKPALTPIQKQVIKTALNQVDEYLKQVAKINVMSSIEEISIEAKRAQAFEKLCIPQEASVLASMRTKITNLDVLNAGVEKGSDYFESYQSQRTELIKQYNRFSLTTAQPVEVRVAKEVLKDYTEEELLIVNGILLNFRNVKTLPRPDGVSDELWKLYPTEVRENWALVFNTNLAAWRKELNVKDPTQLIESILKFSPQGGVHAVEDSITPRMLRFEDSNLQKVTYLENP